MGNAPWEIQRLDSSHDRTQFDSGVAELDDWLQKLAGQHQRRDLARTYVAVVPGDKRVRGYYAISNHRVCFEALPQDQAKGLPRIDVPVVLLGRLAVDRSTQGQGLGEFLLIDALRRASYIAEQIGVRAVEVDAIDDSAKRFYLKYGFVPLRDDPRHLFLPMQVIRKLKLPAF
ncbi:MAG: GNAT family N-acetyltransferase [Pirellulales bacterium]